MGFSYCNQRINYIPAKTNPLHRPSMRLRNESENLLRDIAYVWVLTSQIKEEILRKQEESAHT